MNIAAYQQKRRDRFHHIHEIVDDLPHPKFEKKTMSKTSSQRVDRHTNNAVFRDGAAITLLQSVRVTFVHRRELGGSIFAPEEIVKGGAFAYLEIYVSIGRCSEFGEIVT